MPAIIRAKSWNEKLTLHHFASTFLSVRPSAFIKSPYFFFVHAPVLPLPGFLVAAIMDAYITDAGILCLVAIYAIRKRAGEAGVDPAESTTAQKAAYAPVWIWNHATEQAKVLPGCAKGVG